MGKVFKRYAAVLLVLCMLLGLTPALAASASFGDVPTSHWACANIERLTAAKIIDGYGNGNFGPEDTLTGGQFAKLIAVTEIPDSIDKSVGGAWYTPYVTACKNAKVLTDSQITDWNAPIDRYEMALMMENVMENVRNYQLPENQPDPSSFIKDWVGTPSEYLLGVSQAFVRGLLTGFEDGTFRGSQNMTRAQAAAVICRMSDYVGTVKEAPKPKQVEEVVNGFTVYDDSSVDYSSVKRTAPIKATGVDISYGWGGKYIEESKSPVWFCDATASNGDEMEYARESFLQPDSAEMVKVIWNDRIGTMYLLNRLRTGGDDEFTDRTAHVTLQSMADGTLLWEGDTDSNGDLSATFEAKKGQVGIMKNQSVDENMLFYVTVETQHNGKTYGSASIYGISDYNWSTKECTIDALPDSIYWHF